MTMFLMFSAPCAAVISKPTIRKVTNAMKKLLTKLRVISAVSKAQTLTALTTAARITPMTDITELAQSEINDALAQLKQISEYPTPSTQYARVLRKYIATLVEALDKAQQLATQQGNIACALFDEVTAQRQHIAELEEAEQKLCAANVTLDARAELAERQLAELESRTVTVKPPEPYAYLRENDGQIQISIGAERPSDRSGGYATPWFAIYTAAGIKVEAE
ncbi:hypothetical protein ACLBP2_15470 [Klebsiella pneumoniae]|nr:hypothetical protein [Klebsiella pneumoniae]EKY0548066.1 hypothetical protein [Klebsiella pneumoniae]EKZ5318831.1 hypothetical protein [Klebsiella pneumoniae]EKZ6835872.1 hypothetical protein [Klebsiella pneumoniae]EKZ9591131.1 hypothetical protein [Klebsiella pneumoniae]ELA0594972.1 hypothetical protein [Klebsiella pneumoniae]